MHQELEHPEAVRRTPSALLRVLLGAVSMAFLSCDRPPEPVDAVSTISLGARVLRSAGVTDSVWSSAAAVRVQLATTNGSVLLDDTVLFAEHQVPAVRAPADRGVVLSIEGLNDILAVVWSGSTTLPPGVRDTTVQVTVGMVDLSGTGQGPTGARGTVNAPTLDSTSVAPWKSNTYAGPVRVHLSCITPQAVIHYTLDGSSPMALTPTYGDSGILVDSTLTLKAVAIRPGWTNSSVLTVPFVLQSP